MAATYFAKRPLFDVSVSRDAIALVERAAAPSRDGRHSKGGLWVEARNGAEGVGVEGEVERRYVWYGGERRQGLDDTNMDVSTPEGSSVEIGHEMQMASEGGLNFEPRECCNLPHGTIGAYCRTRFRN